jgi:tetratricopeptide (TPR) repeat protein
MSKRKISRKSIVPKTKGDRQPLKVLSSPPYFLKFLLIFLLLIATLILFWPVQNFEFINLDDSSYVYDNPQVKGGLTIKGLIWAFTNLKAAGLWHPLTWLSYMIDYEFYGLKAGGYHSTNVLLHIASTLLLFLVLERMTRAIWASGLVAALFALHPLHVESVVWVAERKDVLSTFFWMLTLWAYVLYTERPKLIRYLGVLVSFVMGLLSKAMLVTLPCVMLLLDYWPLGRFPNGQSISPWVSSNHQSIDRKSRGWFTHRFVLEKIPFFFLSAVLGFLTFLAQKRVEAVVSLESFPWEARLGNALVTYFNYIRKMIWPHPLAVFYPNPGILPMWQSVGAGLLIICGSILVVRAARKYPYLLLGWLWYLGTLVPVIGLVQVGLQGMADRFTYVPLIGLFIMIAWGVPDILAGWRYRKASLAISASLLLSIFMVVTSLQIRKWQDDITLFKHTLKVTNHNYLIHYNLGSALFRRGKNQEAIASYTEALRINPNYVEAHNNLGIALVQQGKIQEAIASYTEALRIDPNFVKAHNNLGIALAQQGKTQEAIASYTEALRIDPDYAEAHNNLGYVLFPQGKNQEAIAHFTEALRINPNFARAHINLGNALSQQGKVQEAIASYTEALRIDPDYVEAHNNLGIALAQQGKIQEAIYYFTEALRINPNYAEAHNNLRKALALQGKDPESYRPFHPSSSNQTR